MRIGKNPLLRLLFISIVLLLNACVVVVKHNPNGHPPPHTASSFAYWYYYPNSQVYYNITEHYYYYPDGQRWIRVKSLPAGWVLNKGYRVRLKLSGSPYRQHTHHKRQYPPKRRTANGPGNRHHGKHEGRQGHPHQGGDHEKHPGNDHGKRHGLFGKLPGFKTGPRDEQHKPDHANRGKGSDKHQQSEHANRGKGAEKHHQQEHAGAKAHKRPAQANAGKSHGKPVNHQRQAGATTRRKGDAKKGGMEKANRPLGNQQPPANQAEARREQGGVKHTANGKMKAKSSTAQQQRAGNTKQSRDKVTHKTAVNAAMQSRGAHQNTQANVDGNKSAANQERSQQKPRMKSPHNKQQAAKQPKPSGKKQQAGKKQAGKKSADKDKKGAKSEKALAVSQQEDDVAEDNPGNGKGKGRGH